MPVYAHKDGDGRSPLLEDLAGDGGRDERTFAERACPSPPMVDSDVLADELLYLRRAHTRMAIDVGKDVIDAVTKLSEGSPRSMYALGRDLRVSESPV